MTDLRLNLIGSPSIIGGTAPHAILQHPRRLALLLMLALERNGLGREIVASLLWCDKADERARASLSQLLHLTKRELPPGTFISAGSQLRLNEKLVSCDLWEVARVDDEIFLATFLDVRTPVLCPGFSWSAIPEFQDWLDRRNADLALDFADEAWRRATATSDRSTALRLLDVAGRLQPYNEEILRRRLTLLVELGNGAAAVEQYESFQRRLAVEIDARPSKATFDLFASISRQSDYPADLAQVTAGPIAPPTAPGSRRNSAFSYLFGVAVLCASGFVGYWLAASAHAAAAVATVTVERLDVGSTDDSLAVLSALQTRLDSGDVRIHLQRDWTSPADVRLSVTLDPSTGTGVMELAGFSTAPPVRVPISTRGGGLDQVADEVSLLLQLHVAKANGKRRDQLYLEIRNAKLLSERGAYSSASFAIAGSAALLDRTKLPRNERLLLQASIAEVTGWNALRQGARDTALIHFRQALPSIAAAQGSDPLKRDLKLAELNYLAWIADTAANHRYIDRVISHVSDVPAENRTSETWLRLSMALLAQQQYVDAYSAADFARRTADAQVSQAQLATVLFQASFNSYMDDNAALECDFAQRIMPGTAFVRYCRLMVDAWIRGVISPDWAAFSSFTDAHPLHQTYRRRLLLLSAAAAERRGMSDLSALHERLANHEVTGPPDPDMRIAEAVLLASRRDKVTASAMIDSIRQSGAGRRALAASARVLRDVGLP